MNGVSPNDESAEETEPIYVVCSVRLSRAQVRTPNCSPPRLPFRPLGARLARRMGQL